MVTKELKIDTKNTIWIRTHIEISADTEEQLQEEMCDLLGDQSTQIPLMSKIEIGDDVIQEIQRLQNEIKKEKNE